MHPILKQEGSIFLKTRMSPEDITFNFEMLNAKGKGAGVILPVRKLCLSGLKEADRGGYWRNTDSVMQIFHLLRF